MWFFDTGVRVCRVARSAQFPKNDFVDLLSRLFGDGWRLTRVASDFLSVNKGLVWLAFVLGPYS
jgi:hypothetical protein